ncbi:MAG: CapA family protein, partial [Eubacteriales bacterium]|nr:CapA family protein [Eubacteriales bacterium]
MRRRRRRRGGVSFGTVVTLVLTGLVLAGCIYLFPKLVGDIDLRVDPQTVSVAIDDSLRSLRGETAVQSSNISPGATPATAPPMGITTYSQPTATPAPVISHSLSLTFAGSISIDRKIQKACTGENGYTFAPLFEALTRGFQSDYNIATLENLVVGSEKLTDVNMPSDALSAIRGAGINLLCTGFTGVLNSGIDGLAATLNAISANDISAYGAYPTQESRSHVFTLQSQNTMVAFLSYQNELSSSGKKKTTTEEQSFAIAPITLPAITADISAARAAGAQVVVVSLCWGKNGATKPASSQQELAQGIADAGADIIIGTFSGTLQPVELLMSTRSDGSIHQTLCAYSLGYLLASDRSDRESISGALLHISMTYNQSEDRLSFDTISYTPTYIWRGTLNKQTAYRVVISNAAAPDFMSEDQQAVMSRSLALVRERFADSPITEAQ